MRATSYEDLTAARQNRADPGADGYDILYRQRRPACAGSGARVKGRHRVSNGSTLSLPEIEDRIAIVRDNIRQLIEQAAAFSGAEDEERNADRIAQQTEELEKLVKQRDALLKK